MGNNDAQGHYRFLLGAVTGVAAVTILTAGATPWWVLGVTHGAILARALWVRHKIPGARQALLGIGRTPDDYNDSFGDDALDELGRITGVSMDTDDDA